MSTISPERPSPAPQSPADDNQRFVDERIKRTRRALKLVDLGAALITLVIGLVLYLLAAAALEHWVVPGGWSSTGRGVLFAGLVLGLVWYFWRAFWPSLRHSVSPAYAALTIEQGSPSLKNSLLSLLLFRSRRRQLSAPVYQAIEQQAAQRLSQVSLDSSIDRSVLLRLGSALVAVVALCALYCLVLSPPKKLFASVGRVLMPWANIAVPSRVQIVDVQPGSTSIAQGEQLTVSAEVLELASDETVRLLYSTADGQLRNQPVPMSSASGGVRFQCRLPGKRQFGSAIGIQQKLSYWIEAGDARSPRYQIDVFAHPTLVIQRLRYDYPAYTGYESREVETTGDIRALEGTRVTLEALANQPIRNAHVDFQADGRHDVRMSSEEQLVTATFPLELRPDRRTPRYSSYVLKYTTTDGHTNLDPPKYRIEVIPDYAPEIQLLAPEAELLEVGLHDQVRIELEARDPDFSLSNVVLQGTVDDRPIEGPTLLAEVHTGRFVGAARFTPAELGLQVGDLLEYWGEATDNRRPEPNRASTEHHQLRVVERDDQPPSGERQDQGDNQQPAAEQPDDGQQPRDDQDSEAGEQDGEAGQASEKDQQSGDAGQQSGQGEAGGQGEPQATDGQQDQQQPGGEAGESSQEGQNENSSAAGGESERSSADQGDSADAEQNRPGQENGDPGGERPDESPGSEAGQPEKVSAAGDDDATAFHRLAEHFDEQDANNGEAGDNQSADPTAGEQEDAREQADSGEQADAGEQGAPGAEQDRNSQGPGAEGEDPGQPQVDSPSDGQAQQDETAPGGEMSREQGPAGAGDQPGENQGSPDALGDKRPNDKPGADAADRPQGDDQEPAGQGEGQRESDSQSSQGGDRSGGGQEGAGQQADTEGTGAAGENQAADDGAGQADQPGAGEPGSRPGDKEPADSPTGQAGEDQPGSGSQTAEGAGDKPGGAEQGNQPGQGNQPNQPDGAAQDPAAAQPGAGSQQAPPDDGAEQNGQDAPPSSGQSPPSGSGSGGDPAPPTGSELEPADAANLEYAQQKTDLILQRLEDQLRKQQVDRSLLEKLGWNQEELRRFVARWKNLKREAVGDTDAAADARQELDAALRSLGLRKNRRTGFQANSPQDELRDLQEAYRGRTPQEYVEQVRAYVKGTSAARKDAER